VLSPKALALVQVPEAATGLVRGLVPMPAERMALALVWERPQAAAMGPV